ncbi:MAG: lipoprotein insertase outer membrane protein LolB [Halieaceae bacterium]
MPQFPVVIRLLALAALLSACASQPPQSGRPLDWASQQQQLTKLDNWTLSGKVAVSSERGANTARLRWIQRQDDLDLKLSGPVGMQQVTVQRRGEQLTLLRNGRVESIAGGEELFVEEFGWSLPLDYLPWWLRGLPAPQTEPTATRFVDGHLQSLQQAGWNVEYLDYQTVEDYWLPRSIGFSRDQVKGKILLKQWEIPQEAEPGD